MERFFDPELLYVECSRCGQPVLWERGDTSRIMAGAGIDPADLDERCLMISDGCPACTPGTTAFVTRLVRLASADAPPPQTPRTV